MTFKLPELEDDGLSTPDISEWGEEKYRLVGYYSTLFANSMKGKWGSRVYIDLFSGAGRARIKDTNRILPASPLLALDVKKKFDRYIFSEKDPGKAAALEERVKRDYPSVDSHVIVGDTNHNVDKIIQLIPTARPGFTVLSFCFADPFKLKNLAFDTIRSLSARFIDFLVLIPSGMDANRNVAEYTKPGNTTVDRFLGTVTWRAEWNAAKLRGESFEHFLSDYFGRQMRELNYLYSSVEGMEIMRSTDKNLLLYRLAFFSRNELGKKLWEQSRKYSDDQRSFF